MLEQILVHVVGLLRQIQVALALQVIRNQRSDLAALDRKQNLILFDGVAHAGMKIDHLAGQRRQDSDRAIVVQLHFARAAEMTLLGLGSDRFHLDVRQHGRLQFDVVGKLFLRGRTPGVGPCGGGFADGTFLAARDRQRDQRRGKDQRQSHGITSSPTTDAKRLTARR